jgi:hypothetical protein
MNRSVIMTRIFMRRCTRRFDYQVSPIDLDTGNRTVTIYLREHTNRIGTDLPIPGTFVKLPGYMDLGPELVLDLVNTYFKQGYHLQPWERNYNV